MNTHIGRISLIAGIVLLLSAEAAVAQEYFRDFGGLRTSPDTACADSGLTARPGTELGGIVLAFAPEHEDRFVRFGLREPSVVGIAIGFDGSIGLPELSIQPDAGGAVRFSKSNPPAETAAHETGGAVAKDVGKTSAPRQAPPSEKTAVQEPQKVAPSTVENDGGHPETKRKGRRKQLAEIERKLLELQGQVARSDALLDLLKELSDAGRRAQAKKSASEKQIADLLAEVRQLADGAEKRPMNKAAGVKAPIQEPNEAKPVVNEAIIVKPAMNEASIGSPAVSPVTVLPVPAPEQPSPPPVTFTNSLGMKFVVVGDVQFSVHLATVKDFAAFAIATKLKSESWKNPGFKQGPDHPVVNVSWREADAFCKWLTDKERKSGKLKPGESYRLPTDLEWSAAVGLPSESGENPQFRDMDVQDVYPWGSVWPPPAGAGNYAGEESQTDIPIPKYNDGYANTSPVGAFRMNAAGLYDMGGNVWQWVGDYWNSENRAKTLRGGSWYNGSIAISLLSSCRISSSPDTMHDTYGFRIVKAAEPSKSRPVAKADEPAKPRPEATATEPAKASPNAKAAEPAKPRRKK